MMEENYTVHTYITYLPNSIFGFRIFHRLTKKREKINKNYVLSLYFICNLCMCM